MKLDLWQVPNIIVYPYTLCLGGVFHQLLTTDSQPRACVFPIVFLFFGSAAVRLSESWLLLQIYTAKGCKRGERS